MRKATSQKGFSPLEQSRSANWRMTEALPSQAGRALTGFSILELVLTLAVLSLATMLVTGLGRDVFVHNYYVSSALVAQENARGVLKDFLKEVRIASPADNGAYAIEEAAKDKLTFFADIDGEGTRERVRYFWDNATLKKGVTEPVGNPVIYATSSEKISAMASYLVNPNQEVFSYYDSGYDGSSSSSALSLPVDVHTIRLVKIKLLLDNNQYRSPLPLSLEGQVNLRNLKDNL